ncbi:MAG TPA: hypothetical protein VNK91_16120, partial [Burkholderiaceae bacterium]|nr:hypothetical protein [Burkholderiaceae bacterium]
MRALPLWKYFVSLRVETRAIGDTGARLHLLVLQQAWRRLDIVPDRLAQGDSRGRNARIEVLV